MPNGLPILRIAASNLFEHPQCCIMGVSRYTTPEESAAVDEIPEDGGPFYAEYRAHLVDPNFAGTEWIPAAAPHGAARPPWDRPQRRPGMTFDDGLAEFIRSSMDQVEVHGVFESGMDPTP